MCVQEWGKKEKAGDTCIRGRRKPGLKKRVLWQALGICLTQIAGEEGFRSYPILKGGSKDAYKLNTGRGRNKFARVQQVLCRSPQADYFPED